MIDLIRNTKIHESYGPENSHFIGFGSYENKEIVDYILSQHHLNFTYFKKKLAMKALYTIEKKVNEISINNF